MTAYCRNCYTLLHSSNYVVYDFLGCTFLKFNLKQNISGLQLHTMT